MRKYVMMLFFALAFFCIRGESKESLFSKDSFSGRLPSSGSLWAADQSGAESASFTTERSSDYFTAHAENQEIIRDEEEWLRVAPGGEPGDGNALKMPFKDRGYAFLLLLSFSWTFFYFFFRRSIKRRYV